MEPLESIGCQDLLKDSPTFHGHVMKESKSMLSPVTQRYLVLHKGCLYYFKDFNKLAPSGTLSLSGYTAASDIEWRNQPWPFIVRNRDIEKKAYVFGCSSEEERNRWIDHINTEIEVSSNANQETCYNYAMEPVGLIPHQEPNYMPMEMEPFSTDPFSESFNGPSFFSRAPKGNSNLAKLPLVPSRSHSPMSTTPREVVEPSSHAHTLPCKPTIAAKPAVPPRPKQGTDNEVSKKMDRKKKNSYELQPAARQLEERRKSYPTPDSHQIVIDEPKEPERKMRLSTSTRGVPDGEIASPSIYESTESDVLPASALKFDVDRNESESVLRDGKSSGTYLIRKDRSKVNQVLSVVFGKELYHYKVFGEGTGKLHLDKKHPSFDSLHELVSHYYHNFLPTVDDYLTSPFA